MNELVNTSPFIDTLIRGGWVMAPLLLCSVVAVALVLERLFWGPKRQKVAPEALYQEAKHLISRGRFAETMGLCKAKPCALSRLILVALDHAGKSKDELGDVVRSAGRKEAQIIQKRIGILGTIASVSPLLGLLGTVYGMITTFTVIKSMGTGNAGALAGGISEALITTAAGLTIAIPSLIFYRTFNAQARATIFELEDMLQQIVELVISSNSSRESELVATHKASQLL